MVINRGTLAQQEPGFFDNSWPEGFRFPFGEWIKELVFWTVNNPITSWIGDAVEWPFAQLFELILSEKVGRSSIETIPWLWVVAGFFLIGSFVRNTRVGLACGAMLSVCGFLGGDYWSETARTIGMIIVAVSLCALVGIPLGVLSGRVDAVWSVVRPALDAMQVIHPFVFMLPFIFVFGLGNISATMVTMVFALPPIVRLTNLGIRQVPEDVVEASRAYGATELKVLTGVQLPLARPAIMTGLNQTLLLAFSMLGISALMGAGGLGRLLYRAINNLNLGLAASAGLAFFMLAVALDRMSQTDDQDGVSLFTHLRQAWAFRKDPENLLAARTESGTAPSATPDEQPAPVASLERVGLVVGLLGGLVAIVGATLTWTNHAGRISSWARFADENANGELQGQSFSGVAASGGSFFGLLVLGFAIVGVLCAVRPLLPTSAAAARTLAQAQGALLVLLVGIVAAMWLLNFIGSDVGQLSIVGLSAFGLCVVLVLAEGFAVGNARLGADGLLITAFGVIFSAVGHLQVDVSDFVVGLTDGPGPFVAAAGGLIMLMGAIVAVRSAPYAPHRPLRLAPATGHVIALVLALLVVVGSSFGVGNAETRTEYGWLFDARTESVARSVAEGEDRITIVHNGVAASGPGLGWLAIGISTAAIAAGVISSGHASRNASTRWRASAVLVGLGVAQMAVAAAFILSLVRVADGLDVIAGIGAFMTFLAGLVTAFVGHAVLSEFRRTMVYAEWVDPATITLDADLEHTDADALVRT